MLIDVNDFGAWLYEEGAGALTYFVGDSVGLKASYSDDAALVKQMAWQGHLDGRLNLVQRKVGRFKFEFIAQKNRREDWARLAAPRVAAQEALDEAHSSSVRVQRHRQRRRAERAAEAA